MQLTIRNMVCDRCKAVVKRLLDEQGLSPTRVDLGEVELAKEASSEQLQDLQAALRAQGFDLVLDRDAQVITKVKAEVVRRVREGVDLAKVPAGAQLVADNISVVCDPRNVLPLK